MTISKFTPLKMRGLRFTLWCGLMMLFALFAVQSANAAITITGQPQDNEACGLLGSPAVRFDVTITSTGAGAITYQWFRLAGGVGAPITITNGGNFTGATTASLDVAYAHYSANQNDVYYCEITQGAPTPDFETSNQVEIEVISDVPAITVTAATNPICENEIVNLTTTVTGPSPAGELEYRWFMTHDALTVPASGPASGTTVRTNVKTTSNTAVLTNPYNYLAQLDNDQDVIDVEVENVCGVATTTDLDETITVNPKPDVTLVPATSTITECVSDGFSLAYTVSNAALDAASGGGNVNWTVSVVGDAPLVALFAADLTGNGNGTTTIPVAGGTLAPGVYSANISQIENTSNGCTRVLANKTFQVTIYPEPEIEFSTASIDVCEGEAASFTVDITDAVYNGTGVNWSATLTQNSGNLTSNCVAGANAGLLTSPLTGNGNEMRTINIPTTLEPGVYTYTLTAITSNPGGCTGSVGATNTITINVFPKPNVVLSKSTEQICIGNQGSFDITVSNAEYCPTVGGALTDVNWSLDVNDAVDSDQPDPVTGMGDDVINVVSNNTPSLAGGTFTYETVSITNTTHTCSKPVVGNNYVLTVQPAPEVTFSTNAVTVCEGDGGTFDVEVTNAQVGVSGINWTATYTETSGNINDNCNGTAAANIIVGSLSGVGDQILPFNIPATLPPGVYTYTLTGITNTSGPCVGTLGADPTITITVNPKPFVTITPDSSFTCENNGSNFVVQINNAEKCANPTAGATTDVAWTFTYNDNVDSDILPGDEMGMGDQTINLNANVTPNLAAGSHMFEVTGITNTTDACANSDRDSFILTVEPRPEVTFNVPTLNVCKGGAPASFDVQVTNADLNGAGVNWVFDYTESSGNLTNACVAGITADLLDSSGTFTGNGSQNITINLPNLEVGVYTYTLTGIENTDGPCIGNVGANPTITINVFPTPTVLVEPDSAEVCEGFTTTFDITIDSARYCPSVGVATTGMDWELNFVDNVNSNIPANPITGNDNTISTYVANLGGALTAGRYTFRTTTVDITSPAGAVGCSGAPRADSFILDVHPAPVVNFSAASVEVCEGATSSVDIEITNAEFLANPVNWALTYSENSGNLGSNCNTGVTQDIPDSSGTMIGAGSQNVTIAIPNTLSPGIYTYTLTDMDNTTHNCQGVIGATPTVTIRVYPTPTATIDSTSITICEDETEQANVIVTNAEYCAAFGLAPTSVNWSIAYTDAANSTIGGSPLVGAGNGSTNFIVNNGLALTAGTYDIDLTTITNTTNPGACVRTLTGTELTVTVDVLPTLAIDNIENPVCDGLPATVTYTVSDVDAGDNWSFVYEIDGVDQGTISGTGPVVGATFQTISLTPPGVHTLSTEAIINGTTTCDPATGLGPFNITVQALPDVVAFDQAAPGTPICSAEDVDFDVTVTNVPGLDFTVWVTLTNDSLPGGTRNFVWSATGNGTHSFTVPGDSTAYFHAAGDNYTIELIVDSIKVTNPGPYCVNTSVTNDNAFVVVQPRPRIDIDGPAEVCLTDIATIDWTVTGVKSVGPESFTFDWTQTNPVGGPTTVNGDGNNTVDQFMTTPLVPAGTSVVTIVSLSNTTTGCASDMMDTISIIVNPPSNADTLGPDYQLCENEAGPYIITQGANNVGDVQKWQVSTDLGFTWTDIANTTTSLSFGSELITKRYRNIVQSGVCLPDTSEQAQVFIHPKPSLVTGVYTDSICNGEDATVSFTISNLNATQQWSVAYNLNAGPTQFWTPAGPGEYGNGTFTRTLSGLAANTDVNFLSVTNTSSPLSCDSTISQTLTIRVSDQPTKGTITADQVLCAGSDAVIEWTPGTGSVSQWLVSTDNGNTWTASTANGNTLTYNNILDTTWFRAVISNLPCADTVHSGISKAFTLPSNVTAYFDAVPANNKYCYSETNTVTLSIEIENTGGEAWKIVILEGDSTITRSGNGDGTVNYITAPGLLTESVDVTIQSIELTSGAVQCLKALANNATVTLDIIEIPEANVFNVQDPICHGQSPTFSVGVSGVRPGDDWELTYRYNGGAVETVQGTGITTVNLTSTTTATNTTTGQVEELIELLSIENLDNLNTANATCTYSLTDSASVTVDPNSQGGATAYTGLNPVCTDVNSGTITLSNHVGTVVRWEASTNGGTTWSPIINTNVAYTFSNLTTATMFRAIVKSGDCNEAASTATTINIKQLPTVTITNTDPTVICEGEDVTVNMTIANVTAGKDWTVTYNMDGNVYSVNGTGTSHSFTLANVTSSKDITVTAISARGGNGIQCENNNLNETFEIDVIELPMATLASVQSEICEGNALAFGVSVSKVGAASNWTITYSFDGTTETRSGTGPGNFNFTTTALTNNAGTTPKDVFFYLESIVNNSSAAQTTAATSCDMTLSDSMEFTIDPETVGGTIATSSSNPVCKGVNTGVLTLSGNVGDVVKWQYSNSATGNTWTDISNNTNTLTFDNIVLETQYRAMVKSGTCAAANSAPITIQIQELPFAEWLNTSDAEVCHGDAANLDLRITNVNAADSVSVTYELNGVTTTAEFISTGNPFTVSVGTPPLTTTTDFELKSITITKGNPGCTRALTGTYKVTVNPLPIYTVASFDNNICENTEPEINVIVSNVGTNDGFKIAYNVNGGVTQEFTKDGNGDPLVGSGSFTLKAPALATTSNINLTTITNLVTLCALDSTTQLSVVVDDSTEAGVANGVDTVCYASNMGTVTILGNNGQVLKWEQSTDNGTTWTNINNNMVTHTYNNLTTNTLFRALVQNGACDVEYTNPVEIVVRPLPTASFNLTTSFRICENDRATVTNVNVSNTFGASWKLTWMEGSNQYDTTGTGDVTNFGILTRPLAATTDITLVSIELTSGIAQCSNSALNNNAVATVTVYPLPNATITSFPSNVCDGDVASVTVAVSNVANGQGWSLNYNVNGGGSMTWSGTGSGTFTRTTPTLSSPPATAGIRLQSITNGGTTCFDFLTDSVTINIDPKSDGGVVALKSATSDVCKGEDASLVLRNYVGSIVKWQYNEGNGWFDIANTDSTLNITNLQKTTTYRAIVQSGTCPSDISTTFQLDVKPLPEVVIVNPSVNVCKGENATLNLQVSNLSGEAWAITYKVNGTLQTTNITGTGNYSAPNYFQWTSGPYNTTTDIEFVSIASTSGTPACSNMSSEDAKITVFDVPAVTLLSAPDTLCQGDAINFSISVSNVKSNESWTVNYTVNSTNGTRSGTGPGNFTVNSGLVASPTSASISLTSVQNTTSGTPMCTGTSTDSKTIVVNPTTVAGSISANPTTICEGGTTTLTLSGNTGDVVQWEYSLDGGNTWTSTANTGQTLTSGALAQTTQYRVLVKSGVCPAAYTAPVTVTVIPEPDAAIDGNPVVCPGSNAAFDVTVTDVANGVNWTLFYTVNGGAERNVTGSGSGIFNGRIVIGPLTYNGNPTNYTVSLTRITTSTGCENNNLVDQAIAKVTPEPDPAFTVSNACDDTLAVFTNNSTIDEGSITGYKWYFGDGDSSSNPEPNHRYATEGTYNVRLVAVSDNGCKNEVTQTITIYDSPEADFTTSNACLTEPVVFTDQSTTSDNIVSWDWNLGDGSTSTVQNPTHTYMTSGQFTVSLTVTTANGCVDSVHRTVTVYVMPDANFIASSVCEDSVMMFNNTSSVSNGTLSYDWDFAGQGTSNDEDPTFTFNGFGNFDVELIATTSNGCADTMVKTVVVHPTPTADFIANDACLNDKSVFEDRSTVPTGAITEYFWNFGDSTFSGVANPVHTYDRAGTFDVSLIVKSEKGCVHTVTKTATVNPLPEIVITPDGDVMFCDGEDVDLTITNDNGNGLRDVYWQRDVTITDNPLTADTGGMYVVTVVDLNGCMAEDSILITVWDLPVAYAGEDTSIDAGSFAQLEGEELNGHAGVTFSWTPNEPPLTDPNIANPIAGPFNEPGEYTYILTVEDINGCIDDDEVTIIVVDSFNLTIYNVVTPNGDGKNDTWIIDNIDAYPDAEVQIFNRYGMEVFRTTGYNNDWNGTMDGNELPDGAYYYIITLDSGSDKIYKGAINLLRNK